MATAENTINTFQFGRELKVVPDLKTKHGADILLGLCAVLNENSLVRYGTGVMSIFEKPLNAETLKPKPIGYLVFTVGPTSIVCSMTAHLNTMALNSSLPSWVADINEIATGNGLQAVPMEKVANIERLLPVSSYTGLGLGKLLITQLELYARSIGIKNISFDDVNEYAARLLNSLGYIGRRNLKKTLE